MNWREEISQAVQQISVHTVPIQFVLGRLGIRIKPHGRADERSGCQYRIGCVHAGAAAPCVAIEDRRPQRALAVGIPF